MNILVNGVLLGMGYCLIGLGLALIWGVAKVIDIAYGFYGIMAAYVVVMLIPRMDPSFPIWLIFIIGAAAAVGFAIVTHNFLILPVRKQTDVVLVSTIALSLVIQELLMLKEGSEPVYLPAMLTGTTNILGVWTTDQKLFMAGANISIMALLWVLLTRTKLGLAIRATAEQPEAMQLAGGNIKGIFLLAAALAACIGGLGGLLLGPIIPPHPLAWGDLVVIAFAVVMLGGLGNLWGCLPAGLILGISEVAFAIYVPHGGIIKRSIGLIIIFIVLVFRPTGLFGVKGWEEV